MKDQSITVLLSFSYTIKIIVKKISVRPQRKQGEDSQASKISRYQ